MKSKRVRVWAALLLLAAAATAGWAGLNVFDLTSHETIGAELSAGLTQGKTPGTQSHKLSEGPTQCLLEPNRGECVECCKAWVGQDLGKVCARFCHAVPPPGQSGSSDPQ